MFVKENIINENYLNILYNAMTQNADFPWLFIKHTAGSTWNNVEEPSFVHTLFSEDKPNSQYWDMFTSAVISTVDATGIELHKLLRVRLGLITKRDKEVIQGPHVDFKSVRHNTVLFYFNDSDGDTIFYNEIHNGSNTLLTDFTEQKRITPKKNSIVSFDGWQYHSSSSPIQNSHRIVMNINFV